MTWSFLHFCFYLLCFHFAFSVIAFLPFNATGSRDLLMGKLRMSAVSSPLLKTKIDDVELSQEAAELLVLPAYLKYSGKTSCIDELRKMQTASSRSLADEMHVDATGAFLGAPQTDINTLHSFDICGQKCVMPASCMVSSGGRSVVNHAESPYMRIANLLNQLVRNLPDKVNVERERRIAKTPPARIKIYISLECPSIRAENTCTFPGARLLYHYCLYPESEMLDLERHCILLLASPL